MTEFEQFQSALIGFLIIGTYFLPTVIAGARGHKSTMAIGAMNFFLGWSGIFWLWSFIWSLNGNVREAK